MDLAIKYAGIGVRDAGKKLLRLLASPVSTGIGVSLEEKHFRTGKLLIVAALLYDWLIRFLNRDLFYSSNGVLPSSLNAFSIEPWHYSIFYLGNSEFILTACFLLGLVSYLGFAFSTNTRLFAFLSLIFQVSLANRNIYPGFCTDIYSALLLWFILFPSKGPVPRILVFGYIFQIGLIYTASGISKLTPGSEWFNGTALSLIAQYSNITNGLGGLMGNFPMWLQTTLGYGVITMETLALPMLLIPKTRNWMILILLGFHLTTFLTMNLGELPLLMSGALISISTFRFRRNPVEETANVPELTALALPWKQTAVYGTLAVLTLCLICADVYNRVFYSVLSKWNYQVKQVQIPLAGQYVAGLLRIRQTWTMYASPLPKTLVWPMIAVTTKNGRQFNLINKDKVSWKTPRHLAYYYDHRLYKYYNALYGFHAEGRQELVKSCGEFLVHDWNTKNPADPMEHIGIWFAFASIQTPETVRWVKIY